MDATAAKRDVEVCIADSRVLDIWSREFLMRLLSRQSLNENLTSIAGAVNDAVSIR